eukprot:876224-Lingulodinium_polyedra.AAC.1
MAAGAGCPLAALQPAPGGPCRPLRPSLHASSNSVSLVLLCLPSLSAPLASSWHDRLFEFVPGRLGGSVLGKH